MVFATFVAVAGKLGDIIGLRNLYCGGFGLFCAASIACGFAEDAGWLIAARGIQGLGAAAIYPAALAMSTMIFPSERRGQALGIFSGVATVFLVLGPLTGGLLTELVSWRLARC